MNFTPLSVSILAAALCQQSQAEINPNKLAPLSFTQADSDQVEPSFKPQLMLANLYQQDIDIQQYWISEKLDGVRAYWDGKQLRSRQGYPIHAPLWFTQALPKIPLDGELWRGRGEFEATSAAIRRYQPLEHEWREIRFRVFDLPSSELPFEQRILQLQQLTEQINVRHLEPLSHQRVSTHEELQALLQQQVKLGAEGLMLNHSKALYQGKRTDDLLKLKSHQDDEAVVIKHLPGKGKYRGMLGAILVALPSGQQFKIGSGFTDQQRLNPPSIGSLITFKYFGLSHSGVPRFASFMRDHEHFDYSE